MVKNQHFIVVKSQFRIVINKERIYTQNGLGLKT